MTMGERLTGQIESCHAQGLACALLMVMANAGLRGNCLRLTLKGSAESVGFDHFAYTASSYYLSFDDM